MTDVVALVDGLDLVVGLSDGHLHPDDLATARKAAREARERVGHLGSTLVAALLGGTGAGKSSLLNALAGEAVASTSPVRPHTTEPLAWLPEGVEPSLHRLLDTFGVTRRVTQGRIPGVALLDMTDVDSVEIGHRDQVEELLPSIDVAVWVLDPLKYAEGQLHRDFIRPLAGAADRMIFVLNQIDKVPLDERGAMRDHLAELLRADGIDRPRIFEVAADPPEGPPIAVDELLAHLRNRLDEKRVHLGRVIESTRAAVRHVAGVTGVTTGGSLDFEQRWERVRVEVVTLLVARGATIAAVEEALRQLEHMIGIVSGLAGGVFGMRMRQVFSTEALERHIRESVAVMDRAVDALGGKPREQDRLEAARQALDLELQERIGAPMRKLIWERASLSAVVAGLSVDASMAEANLGIGLRDPQS